MKGAISASTSGLASISRSSASATIACADRLASALAMRSRRWRSESRRSVKAALPPLVCLAESRPMRAAVASETGRGSAGRATGSAGRSDD